MTQAADPRFTKIQALLTKANDAAATEAEAEAYREKAYALMIKWEIDEAQLSAEKSERLRVDEIIRRTVHLNANMSYSHEFATAMAIIGDAAGLHTFITKTRKNEKTGKHATGQQRFTAVTLVGFRPDVERAELLIESLVTQLHTAMLAYGKTLSSWYTASQKWNARRSFIVGWGGTVADRVRSLRDVARQDATDRGTGTELVLVTKDDMVSKWIEDNMHLGKPTCRRYGSNAMYEGGLAGRQADIGQNRFGAAPRGAVER